VQLTEDWLVVGSDEDSSRRRQNQNQKKKLFTAALETWNWCHQFVVRYQLCPWAKSSVETSQALQIFVVDDEYDFNYSKNDVDDEYVNDNDNKDVDENFHHGTTTNNKNIQHRRYQNSNNSKNIPDVDPAKSRIGILRHFHLYLLVAKR
jgi:hypothetical protein